MHTPSAIFDMLFAIYDYFSDLRIMRFDAAAFCRMRCCRAAMLIFLRCCRHAALYFAD